MTEVILDLPIADLEEWLLLNNVASKEVYLISIFLGLALLTVLLAKKYKIPIVVGYVFLGILMSPDVIALLPTVDLEFYRLYTFVLTNLDYITHIALAFIAFTIGSELSIVNIKRLGKSIFYIVLIQSVAAFALVVAVIYLLGWPLYVALLLGAIATATAPAATVMVLKEYNAKGPLTSTIMAVIGIDDAVALIVFSLISPIAYSLYLGSLNLHYSEILLGPLFEIAASIAIGLAVGYFGQQMLTIFNEKTKKVLSLLVMILTASSAALYFNFSPLIANMTVGFAVRNFSRKNLGISEYMDVLTIPLYALFFILAGTEIRFSAMTSLGFFSIAAGYFTARVIGKVGGATLAARISGAPEAVKKYVGLGLIPQSGVGIALAFAVQKQYVESPQIGILIFNTLLLTSALTEIIGPLLTKYALSKSGEAKNL